MSELLPAGMVRFRAALARVAEERFPEEWAEAKPEERAFFLNGDGLTGFWLRFLGSNSVGRQSYGLLRPLLAEGALPAVKRGHKGPPEAVDPAFWTSSSADRLADVVRGETLIRMDDLDAVLKGEPAPRRAQENLRIEMPPPAIDKPRGAKRGRRHKVDINDFWIEVCCFVHDNGIPKNEAEFHRYLAQWCENTMGDDAYAEGSIRDKVRPLLRRLRPRN